MSIKRLLFYFLPLVIFVLLSVSYYMYIVHVCGILVTDLLESCVYLFFYNVACIMLVWSLLATVFMPPATVPDKYKLSDAEVEIWETSSQRDAQLFLQSLIVKKHLIILTVQENGFIRYCKPCRQIKPDRTHHCSDCEICVLRMDHHCPWVNNCIGFSNYKCFLLLMVYSIVYSIFGSCTMYMYILRSWNNSKSEYVPVFASFVISLGFGCVGGIFLMFNCDLLRTNETVLERMRSPNFVQRNVSFNLGCKRNFLEVFGPNCLLWPLPFFTGLGSGDICAYSIKDHV